MVNYYSQETSYTCGAASMRMAFEKLGIKKSEKQMIRLLGTNKVVGTLSKKFPKLAEKYKFTYITGRKGSIMDLKKYLREEFIIILCYHLVHEDVGHYAILKRISDERIYLIDPFYGKNHSYKKSYFMKIWRNPHEKDLRWFFGIKKK